MTTGDTAKKPGNPLYTAAGGGNFVSVRIPGSSGNVGPGFDALGLALGVYCDLSFRMLDEDDPSVPLITAVGPAGSGLAADQSNLVYRVLSTAWSSRQDLLKRVRITIDTEIPLQRGLGSSAAAILGTVWAAAALTGRTTHPEAMLAQATAIEGHPDNVAASLYGALVVSAQRAGDKSMVARRIDWPEDWQTLVVVPPYRLSTKKARAVLPCKVPLSDAVVNIQRTALLIAAVTNRDEDALRDALHDRLHEPYREALVPELGALRRELKDLPVLGCVLSGAGPSVLVIVQQQQKPLLLEHLICWAASRDQPPLVLDLKVDTIGLRLLEALNGGAIAGPQAPPTRGGAAREGAQGAGSPHQDRDENREHHG